MSAPYDPAAAAATLFHPLADPDQREQDPLRALQAAHDLRILLGLAEVGAVRHARRAGWTWSDVGECLGFTKQAAQQRFGLLVDLAAGAEVVEAQPLPSAP
jgi:hypothetical protein